MNILDFIIIVGQAFFTNINSVLYGIVLVLIYTVVMDHFLMLGQRQIQVTIIKLDKENNKISLTYKKAEDDPWANLKLNVDDVVNGKVVSLKPFGAFVELENGIEALVHISNITNKRIAKPDDALRAVLSDKEPEWIP